MSSCHSLLRCVTVRFVRRSFHPCKGGRRTILHPVLKRDGLDQSDPANYRPIANVSFISKILERIIASHLVSYFYAYDCSLLTILDFGETTLPKLSWSTSTWPTKHHGCCAYLTTSPLLRQLCVWFSRSQFSVTRQMSARQKSADIRAP